MNVIRQIVSGEGDNQSIKMIVKANERGPQGEQGAKGDAATIAAGEVYAVEEGQQAVINTGTSSNAVFDFYLPKGPKGDDGAIKYTAGTGIKITDGNVIEATGDATAAWGGIQGDITDQTDLQNEFAEYTKTADLATVATTGDYDDLTDKPTIPTVNDATLTIQNNGTNVATFTANSSTNTTANIVPPVQIGSVLSTPTDVDYVNTANIVDGAVSTAKFAQSAVNNGIKSANNITPTADTPTAWATAFGSDGLYLTTYTSTGLFTDQPGAGNLETIVNGTEVTQTFYEDSDVIWFRHGSGSTWGTTSYATGSSFVVVRNSTTAHIGQGIIIPNNANLNTADYAMPGEYTGTGASMTNCPTTASFRLIVDEVGRSLHVTPSSTYVHMLRTLIDYNGTIFVQRVYSDSQGQWTFDAWRTIAGGNDGTIPITSAFTPNNGYTTETGYVFLKANTLFIVLGVHKDSGNFGADEVVGKLQEWAAPVAGVPGGVWLSNNSIWLTNDVGYLFITGKNAANPNAVGEVTITDSSSSHSYAKICMWIPLGY